MEKARSRDRTTRPESTSSFNMVSNTPPSICISQHLLGASTEEHASNRDRPSVMLDQPAGQPVHIYTMNFLWVASIGTQERSSYPRQSPFSGLNWRGSREKRALYLPNLQVWLGIFSSQPATGLPDPQRAHQNIRNLDAGQMEKEFPHPQVVSAFGLSTTNREPCKSSR